MEELASDLLGVTPATWPTTEAAPKSEKVARALQTTLLTYLRFAAYMVARAPEFLRTKLLDGTTNSQHWVFKHPLGPARKYSWWAKLTSIADVRLTAWYAGRQSEPNAQLKDVVSVSGVTPCCVVQAH